MPVAAGLAYPIRLKAETPALPISNPVPHRVAVELPRRPAAIWRVCRAASDAAAATVRTIRACGVGHSSDTLARKGAA